MGAQWVLRLVFEFVFEFVVFEFVFEFVIFEFVFEFVIFEFVSNWILQSVSNSVGTGARRPDARRERCGRPLR
jgi:hypothetical protein